MDEVLQWVKNAISLGAGALLASSAGRFAWHLYKVKAGERKFFGIGLALEAMVALLMAIVAVGIGEWADLGPKTVAGLAGMLGWLGPKGLEAWAIAIVERRRGGRE